jgi:hypothetical protein
VKLKIVEEARHQYRVQREWWIGNADHKQLFAEEFRDALHIGQSTTGS